MKEKYSVGNLTLTRRKATFGQEARVKQAAGLNDEDSELLLQCSKELASYQTKLAEAKTEEERVQILVLIQEAAEKIQKMRDRVDWAADFNKAKSVLAAMVSEDVSSLTVDDFTKWEVMQIWDDFFTRPNNSEKK